MFKSFLDDILLFNAGRTAESLFIKERENREKKQGSIRSSEIPDEYDNKDYIEDIKTLEQAFRDYDKLNSKDGKNVWTCFSVYLIILKTFKKFYGIYSLLFFINLIISYFVKVQAKEFFNFFVSENSSKPILANLLPGLFLIILQIFSIVFTTHCEYYNSWVHFKVQSAISGSSLLRFLECKRLKNKQGLCILDNNSSTEILSLYQNIILVDSDFTEFAISNSINIILYPLHIFTSALVAHSVFGGTPLILCLLSLFTCFLISAVTQVLSAMYKKPFLKAREERVEETSRLLEQSKYLSVTQQLFSSIHLLISRNRNIELHYNSLRKYICMITEVFDNWITLSCTLVIGSYIFYNKIPVSQASIMIIQSAWLIPTFYHPLNDILFFVYFIIEGTISIERIAQFLFFTQNDPSQDIGLEEPSLSNSNISGIVLNNVSFFRGKNVAPSVINVNLNISPGVPCFVLGKFSSGKSALLEGIAGLLFSSSTCQNGQISGFGAGGSISFKLENGQLENISDISSRALVGYVPQLLWVPTGLPLSDLILCGSAYNQKLWQEVIYQCDLEMDFLNWGIRSFEETQKMVVTDKQFSTGQKVRLSLARAIYSTLSNNENKPRIFLIDCVLNSLDPFVCKIIIERLFSKNGLLSDSMSVIVIEPPILEFIKQASNNNGFSYKIVNMSDKMITSTEEVTVNCVRNSSGALVSPGFIAEKKPNVTKCDLQENPQDLKIVCNEGIENTSEIDIQKNKYSHYYPTSYFYMFVTGSKKIVKNLHSFHSDFKGSSFESFMMIFMLVLPQIMVKLGESLFLIILEENSITNLNWNSIEFFESDKLTGFKTLLFKIPSLLGYNVLSFWSLFYNTALVISMISTCIALLLEIRIGFRAARYFHNSVLLGYLGATSNSILRWLPMSFILNRLSNDQLQIDYCITRRIRFVIIILNSIFISAIPLIFGSVNSFLTLTSIGLVAISIYHFFIRYFTNGCRTLRSCYISEYSPLVDTIQTIGKGKKCINSYQVKEFFFETTINRINSVLKPRFAQICLDSWFKMRIKILLTIPVTFINIILPYVSNNQGSSTRSVIALAIATATGLAPLLSILVGYWSKLETELVSVERSRLYLAASREAGSDYLEHEKEKHHSEQEKGKVEIELKNVEAEHSRLDSKGNSNFDNSHLIGTKIIHIKNIRGITANFKAGEVIGIIGRTGSGKTTLLDVLSNLLPCKSGKMTVLGLENSSEKMFDKLESLKFPFKDFDPMILKSIIMSQKNLSHIAFLPLEVYFHKNGIIWDIVDPLKEYDLDNIKAALSICGFESYLERNESSNSELESIDCDQESALLSENNAVLKFLETKLDEIKFGILQMRMLLFVNFFLKKDKLRIILVDEPPVVLRNQMENSIVSNGKMNKDKLNEKIGCNNSECILSSVINKYFKHCITFIASHDIRSLQYASRVLVLSSGKIIKDTQLDRNSFSNSELFSFMRTDLIEK
ncbi:ion efflux transporter [Cryptosporidium ubiquitum]|uniref:Ion efflux transporter n=1 Tax=Cryptosporidium ubiquitum TaxID=857276 RepID=A0A1J4MFJ4_9CRYT|nr:ion efflux transporter [Cryptosporidium ubiquitum]OII72235.1 ion efflux transporter [Cryptosporidium ubiquitum]